MTSNSSATPGLCGKETILLVEDDDRLRAVLSTILRRHGYRVLEARNGDEALQLGASALATIDLLLTDVVMPRMNGRQLSEHVVRAHTRVRVLFMSGYSDDAVVRLGVLHSEIAFLEKPITPVALVRKLREVLDARDRQ